MYDTWILTVIFNGFSKHILLNCLDLILLNMAGIHLESVSLNTERAVSPEPFTMMHLTGAYTLPPYSFKSA